MLEPMIDIPLAFCMRPRGFARDYPKPATRSRRRSAVGETRKLAAILVSDVVGYSRLDWSTTSRIARLRALRSDLIDSDHRRASWSRG